MKSRALALALILAVFSTACSPFTIAGSTGRPPTPVVEYFDPTANCHKDSADTQQLVDPVHGYCLRYPTGYTAQKVSEEETVIYTSSLLSVEPRVYILVQLAEGRTAGDAAQALIADAQAALPGFKAQGSPVSMGGSRAIVIEHLPGQDISRVVLFEQTGRLFKLTFVPTDGNAETSARMETLYKAVVESFTWLLQ